MKDWCFCVAPRLPSFIESAGNNSTIGTYSSADRDVSHVMCLAPQGGVSGIGVEVAGAFPTQR